MPKDSVRFHISCYLSEEDCQEMLAEAKRQRRPISQIAQLAWEIAKERIKAVEVLPGTSREVYKSHGPPPRRLAGSERDHRQAKRRRMQEDED